MLLGAQIVTVNKQTLPATGRSDNRCCWRRRFFCAVPAILAARSASKAVLALQFPVLGARAGRQGLQPAIDSIVQNVNKSGDENAEEIPGPDPRFANPAALPQLAAVLTAVLGLLVLAGWAFAIPVLKSVLPGAVEMTANTAVGLVLAACALFIRCDRPSPVRTNTRSCDGSLSRNRRRCGSTTKRFRRS